MDTVGEGAVELADGRPFVAFAILVAAGSVKAVAAAVPFVVERTRGGRLRRVVRVVSWAGGAFLVVYGSAVAAISAAVLTGVISPEESIDRRGLTGHALLWDPLFVVWGVLLLAGLWLTREGPRPVE